MKRFESGDRVKIAMPGLYANGSQGHILTVLKDDPKYDYVAYIPGYTSGSVSYWADKELEADNDTGNE